MISMTLMMPVFDLILRIGIMSPILPAAAWEILRPVPPTFTHAGE